MHPSSPKCKRLYHLVGIIVAVALVFGANWSKEVTPSVTEPTTDASRIDLAASYGFTIQNVSIGMSRDAVERIFGPGDPDGLRTVGYGESWIETNPFEVERRGLEVHYNKQNVVVSITGSSLCRNGVGIKPHGPKYELEGFGPSDGVGIAVRDGGDFDSAVMLSYPKAGVHIEYYDENRMWFTVLTPYEE